MSQTNGTAAAAEDVTFNPVLLRLKQEAEDEVNRLRAELLEVRYELAYPHMEEHSKQQLKLKESSLQEALTIAQRRLETELTAIRQHEMATPPAAEVSFTRAQLP